MNLVETLRAGTRSGFRTLFPGVYFHIKFARAEKNLGNVKAEQERLFEELLSNASEEGRQCLQIGVKEHEGKKYGSNWVAVDLFDTRDFVDYNYDIHDLKFEDNKFDVAVCISILEHVPHPEVAIAELTRVLKPGGFIWVQLPFHYPYHECPKDYWRVSPDGLRVWMSGYEEIGCGSVSWARTGLATSTFFYGRKPR